MLERDLQLIRSVVLLPRGKLAPSSSHSVPSTSLRNHPQPSIILICLPYTPDIDTRKRHLTGRGSTGTGRGSSNENGSADRVPTFCLPKHFSCLRASRAPRRVTLPIKPTRYHTRRSNLIQHATAHDHASTAQVLHQPFALTAQSTRYS